MIASTALLVLRTSSTVNSRLLFNLLHPSSTPCYFWLTRLAIRIFFCICSGSVTRACSYSHVPALPEVFVKECSSFSHSWSRSQSSSNIGFTLGNLSALEDCRRIFTSATLAVSLSFDDSNSDSLLGSKRRICSISLRMLSIIHWSRLHATIVLQVFFPLATAHLLSLGHLLHCIGCSMLLCCTWFLSSAALSSST